ncbi:MAG: YIP1 family protein [Deltaproteobacteria bacterium]|nr:YIP1 family protein [Deltaproteobacteria bacterium]
MEHDPSPGPPPPHQGAGAPLTPIPWEDRQRLGFAPALLGTVKLFVSDPKDGFRRIQEQGDLASPILFAVLLGWAAVIIGQIWSFLIGSSFLFLPGLDGEAFTLLAGRGLMTFGILLLAPLFVVIGLFIGSGIFHLFLLLVGGTERSQAGFEGTLRVVAYSSVTQLAQILPIFGALFGTIWALVLFTIGLSILHRTSQGKALAAVLIPILLCCVCGSIAAVMGLGSLMMAFQSA